MPRLHWPMISLAIEPDEACGRSSAVRLASHFEHAAALVGDSISISTSPHVMRLGPRQTDIYLGIKTCH